MSENVINFIGEGPSDDALARRIIVASGGLPGISRRTPFSGTGKSNLDKRLKGLNAGLAYSKSPLLILRDLDNDAPCASLLVDSLIANKHKNMLLRIAVRASEAWVMADSAAYSDYCGVKESYIPSNVDLIPNAKQHILGWIDRKKTIQICQSCYGKQKERCC